jgi:hypothetical protein
VNPGGTLIARAQAPLPRSDDPPMESKLPPLHEVLDRLPWFGQLSDEHRADMLAEFSERLLTSTSREEFTRRLTEWAAVAHRDAKWARFHLLQESGLLPPDSQSNRAA